MPEKKKGKMENVGRKPRKDVALRETIFPSLYLTTDQLSQLKGKDFGDTVTIHAQGKITGISQRNDNKKSFDIEIRKMSLQEDKVKSFNQLKSEIRKKELSRRKR